MTATDSDDALVCCVENTVEDHIMDSGVLFHATYCKEELKRFKLRSGKARLADDKTLDIAGVGDVILKTSYGTSWTLKDVRDQKWKVAKASLVVAHGNKRRSLYMVEISTFVSKIFWESRRIFLHNVNEDKETVEITAGVTVETPLRFGVVERLSRTFRAESTGIRAEAMLWADSVSTTYLIYRISYVLIGLRIPEDEWRGKDTSLAHLKAEAQMKCDTAFGIRRVT
ncbi:hypothetical protein Tco_1186717, partial [Tanacetum coccineum]